MSHGVHAVQHEAEHKIQHDSERLLEVYRTAHPRR